MKNLTTGAKIQIFFYCVKKTLLVNVFQKNDTDVPKSSHFGEIRLGKFEIPLDQPEWAM